MTPFNRLRQTAQQQPGFQQSVNPAPAGMPLEWQQGIGGEGEGGGQGFSDAATLLGQYLKKRQNAQGASPADALTAFKAGGSL